MKIGGHGEFWMIVGPLAAVALLATLLSGGPADMVATAERMANDAWSATVTAFRR